MAVATGVGPALVAAHRANKAVVERTSFAMPLRLAAGVFIKQKGPFIGIECDKLHAKPELRQDHFAVKLRQNANRTSLSQTNRDSFGSARESARSWSAAVSCRFPFHSTLEPQGKR